MENKDIIKHASCPNCPSTEEILPMGTRLYNNMGGWKITKDGELYFQEEAGNDKEFDENKPLIEIEVVASVNPDSEWKAHLDLPLRSAVYQRQENGEWVLIEKGIGFA